MRLKFGLFRLWLSSYKNCNSICRYEQPKIGYYIYTLTVLQQVFGPFKC